MMHAGLSFAHMTKTGTGKEKFQVISVFSVANVNFGDVIVPQIPHQPQQTSRTENGWGLSERDGPLLTSQTNL